jgi:sterol desaturase/sphingolipid hydroxylase (fatty acid hydroxylase superfamily)
MDEKRDISEEFSKVTEAIEKNSFITKLKRFNILSWLGIVLTIFFIICSFINITNLTWWVMLPIFIIAFIALFSQRKKVAGLEKTFVITTLWVLLIIFFIRDALLSEKLIDIYYNLANKVEELKAFF